MDFLLPLSLAASMICGIITEVAAIAQLVERIHGKDEVPGSNPGRGSIFYVLEFVFETCPNNRTLFHV